MGGIGEGFIKRSNVCCVFAVQTMLYSLLVYVPQLTVCRYVVCV